MESVKKAVSGEKGNLSSHLRGSRQEEWFLAGLYVTYVKVDLKNACQGYTEGQTGMIWY